MSCIALDWENVHDAVLSEKTQLQRKEFGMIFSWKAKWQHHNPLCVYC